MGLLGRSDRPLADHRLARPKRSRSITLAGVMRIAAWWTSMILIPHLLAACGSDSVVGDDVARSEIGPDGGTLVSTDGMASLHVRSGALASMETITLQRTTSQPPESLGHPVGDAYTFGPSGLTFDRPVTVTIHIDAEHWPSGMGEDALTLVAESGGEWRLLRDVRVDRQAKTISGDMDHFSTVHATAGTMSTCAGTVPEATHPAVANAEFIWPLDPGSGAVLTQAYADFNAVHDFADKYHTALDIGKQEKDIPVYATAAGTIIHAGWVAGFGNTVIVHHHGGADEAIPLYSMYAHLACIMAAFTVEIKARVETGEALGFMGNTGFHTGDGASALSGTHLHFEVRNFPEAASPGGGGYTARHPENHGYFDPVDYFFPVITEPGPRTMFVTPSAPVNALIRPWPTTSFTGVTLGHMNQGEAFLVTASTTKTDDCARGWYRIRAAEESLRTGSIADGTELYFLRHENDRTILIRDAWVCRGTSDPADGSEDWLSPTIGPIVPNPPAGAPMITAVTPHPVPGSDERQWITLGGKNFQAGASVTLTASDGTYAIPSDRTSFVSSSRIDIFVNLTTAPDDWWARVRNPDGGASEPFGFTVIAPSVGTTIESGVVTSALPSGDWRVAVLHPSVLSGSDTFIQVGAAAALTPDGSFVLDLSAVTPPPVALHAPSFPHGVVVHPPDVEGANFSLIIFDDVNGNQRVDAGEPLYVLNDPDNTFGEGALNLEYADRHHTIQGASETTAGTPVSWQVEADDGWGRTIYRTVASEASIEVTYSNVLAGLMLEPVALGTVTTAGRHPAPGGDDGVQELLLFGPR